MRIGILKCDSDPAELCVRHGQQEDRAIKLLKAADPDVELLVFDVRTGSYPFTPDDCDGYLCLGSVASVNDSDCWIRQLEIFMCDLSVYEIPTVGICFGHQLIARALGGACGCVPSGGHGHGVLPLEIVRGEDWMKPDMEHGRLVYFHHEQVTRLPERSVLLGSSPHCPNALVRFRRNFLGIQGHPEMSREYARMLLRTREDGLSGEEVGEALASLEQPQDGGLIGGWLLGFLRENRRSMQRARPCSWG